LQGLNRLSSVKNGTRLWGRPDRPKQAKQSWTLRGQTISEAWNGTAKENGWTALASTQSLRQMLIFFVCQNLRGNLKEFKG
jgi:hypothetical protein